MKAKVLWFAAILAAPCLVSFWSCDKENQDDKNPVDSQGREILVNTDILKTVDDNYSPSLAELQKTWAGEYEGWDANQATENHVGNTNIRRLLILNPNGSYRNVIQGVILEGKSEYVDFEHEVGTYTYDANKKLLTYIVKSDSVLKYDEQKLLGFNGKKYYKNDVRGTYTEEVRFTTLKDGKRSWVARDTYLQAQTDKTINICFAMDEAKVEERR